MSYLKLTPNATWSKAVEWMHTFDCNDVAVLTDVPVSLEEKTLPSDVLSLVEAYSGPVTVNYPVSLENDRLVIDLTREVERPSCTCAHTALYTAMGLGRMDVVRAFWKEGVFCAKEWLKAMAVAVYHGWDDAVEYLHAQDVPIDLSVVLLHAHISCVYKWVERGVRIIVSRRCGNHLIVAAHDGHLPTGYKEAIQYAKEQGHAQSWPRD